MKAENIAYLVKRYAVPYQLTSSREWNWPVIFGMACGGRCYRMLPNQIYILKSVLTNGGNYEGIKQQ
jgi:hypothetical protein